MGVGVSYAYHCHREALNRFAGLHRQALIYFGVICFLPAFIWTLETSAFLNTIGLTWFSIGASAILLGTLHVTDGVETLWLRFAAHLGSGSYSVYLWHMLVAAALTPLMQGLPLLIWVGLYTATSFAVGLLMARLIEQPALAARNRLFPPVQSVASASSLTVRAL